jgi:hypothetical protein
MKSNLVAMVFTALVSINAYSQEEEIIPCGDAMMSRAFSAAYLTLGEDEDIGTVDARHGTNRVITQYHDIYCDQDRLVFSFSNGGRLVFDSYWGTYLPSPTGSTVQAFNGTLTMPGMDDVQAKFWIDAQSANVIGHDFRIGFLLVSRWF